MITAVLLAVASCVARGADLPKSDTPKPGEPTDPKARKTFESARDWEKQRNPSAAVDAYRKANKQDGGHCTECLRRAFKVASSHGDYKSCEAISREWLAQAQTDSEKASMHYRIAWSLQQQGIADRKDKCFIESCNEFKAALESNPHLTLAHLSYGVSLAHLHQDDTARSEFTAFLNDDKQNAASHQRAQRFLDRIDLARATMAPAFAITTLDGQQVSMDDLAGKVVLIDFWATWCGPCREALPRIRKIAQKFQGQPLVVLSVSLDADDAKWRDFVGKNGMMWLQYRDPGNGGRLATQFNVHAIPATFTIDADGVLEDAHVGDADIEGKLKKLVAQATERGNRKPVPVLAAKTPDDPE